MIRNRLFALASVISCALTVGAHAQTQVAFIGGNITYSWQTSGIFGTSNASFDYVGYGFTVDDLPGPCRETSRALTALKTIIASGKKPIIHLMVGADDAASTDDANPVAWQLQSFETCFAGLITTAQNAKLKIVVGTNPFGWINSIEPYNKYIFSYCASKGVPVIDYQTLLKQWNDNFEGTQFWIEPVAGAGPIPDITNKGYAVMNSAAESVLAQTFTGVTLKAGYLGNEYLQLDGGLPNIPGNEGNTVFPGAQMHWYAFGEYSDGVTRQIENANVLHVYGTWTSSNPSVISIDPYGTAWALAPGTANIHFTTPSGQTVNEWTMTVDPFSNQDL